MKKSDSDYERVSFPNSRVATFDIGRLSRKKHHIVGLLEVDITKAKTEIKNQLKAGNNTGVMPWLLKVIADTVAENKQVQAMNTTGNRQYVFKDVDISSPLERQINGQRVPLMMVCRKANTKSIEEIAEEIQASAKQKVSDESDYVLSEKSGSAAQKLFFNLPQFLRMLIWNYILRHPKSIKESMGSVIVTNIGSKNMNGWIIPKSIHNLCFGIGGISRKPWVVENEIRIRTILCLTVIFNHDSVDGMSASQFTARLVKNIESGYGLTDV